MERTTNSGVRWAIVACLVLIAAAVFLFRPEGERQAFVASAYALDGLTKSGEPARPGVVAADPNVLPIGSTIRIHGADEYSGTYTVLDTGRKIKGARIDIFMEDRADASDFGKRQVEVEILSLGEAEGG